MSVNSVREILKKIIKRLYEDTKSKRSKFARSFLFNNPFHVNGSFPYPSKTSEKLWFSESRERDQRHERVKKRFRFLLTFEPCPFQPNDWFNKRNTMLLVIRHCNVLSLILVQISFNFLHKINFGFEKERWYGEIIGVPQYSKNVDKGNTYGCRKSTSFHHHTQIKHDKNKHLKQRIFLLQTSPSSLF